MIRTLTAVFLAVMLLTGCRSADPAETASETVPNETAVSGTSAESDAETAAPEPEYAENPDVRAMYASEYTGEYDEYAVTDSGYASKVVFTTNSAVRDFTLHALTVEFGESITFTADEIFRYGELTPEKAWCVTMMIPETIPYCAVSYTDGTGATRYFSVNWSGMDGSVYLSEIKISG
ncbi:MAG: hypothetical protein IJ037_05905 [Clostridia bacterium]|nr:hypothetical protein [Clostridia bacterium]MBQ8370052.1 hypothetical protein [Clostridia bacterium]